MLLAPGSSWAHDASSYGGVFRSRNAGKTWLNADAGLFLYSALTVAVSPRDPGQLLLGTDTGLLRSRNGGQSWVPEASEAVLGAVFAAAFAPDGRSAICAAPSGVFRFDGEQWERVAAPAGAVPARAIAFGATPGRAYLLGRGGLFTSDDEGRSFRPVRTAPGNGAEMTTFAISTAAEETLLVLAGGTLWASTDGGSHWDRRGGAEPLSAAVLDPAIPRRLWVAAHGTLSVSDDLGRGWREAGQLPGRNLSVHGIAADPDATGLVVATDRGMYRSNDGGRTWQPDEGTLPVHLEAGPLIRDPGDPRTLYAVFSLIPYADEWRVSVEGSNLLSRLDLAQMASGVAFVLLVMLTGAVLVRWLARVSRALQP